MQNETPVRGRNDDTSTLWNKPAVCAQNGHAVPFINMHDDVTDKVSTRHSQQKQVVENLLRVLVESRKG